MLFLGVLSVFQMVALPGLLLIRLFPGRRSLIQQTVYVFMLSLLANHTLVLILVALGIYLRSVVLVLFAAQVFLLAWLYRAEALKSIGAWGKQIRSLSTTGLRSFAERLQKDYWPTVFYFVFGVLAVGAILWVLWVWVVNFNTVFQAWDAWASWDRWAEKWADNRFPGDTWEYPQLIPITYSLGYKFIGTVAVKFFGKSIMPLFTLAIGLMLFDLGLRKRSFGYMLASGLSIYTINFFFSKYIADGYVDIPVACFSLMAIYTLLVADEAKKREELGITLLLGSLATATAAVTKQTGLYIFALYPLLAYVWVLRQRKDFTWHQSLVLLGRQLLLATALVLPWYAFMQYRIWFGGNVSNIQYVIHDIYDNMTMWDRFLAALTSLGPYVYVFAFAILSLLVLNNRLRQLVVLLIIPFATLWAFFLSYEVRNLAVALPPLAMVAGAGAEAWFLRLRTMSGKPRRVQIPRYGFVILAGLLLAGATLMWSDADLVARQITQQKQIYEPELNKKLYAFFSREGGPQPVLTSYPIGWLPDLQDTWLNERFSDYDMYQQSLLRYPEVTLMLVPIPFADVRIQEDIYAMIDEGIYEPIFTEAHYTLIRIPPR